MGAVSGMLAVSGILAGWLGSAGWSIGAVSEMLATSRGPRESLDATGSTMGAAGPVFGQLAVSGILAESLDALKGSFMA